MFRVSMQDQLGKFMKGVKGFPLIIKHHLELTDRNNLTIFSDLS